MYRENKTIHLKNGCVKEIEAIYHESSLNSHYFSKDGINYHYIPEEREFIISPFGNDVSHDIISKDPYSKIEWGWEEGKDERHFFFRIKMWLMYKLKLF
jgi:hypothetical protein